MSYFLGSEISVLDAKGRINIPARLRRGLAPEAKDTFVIVRGFDPCVNLYPLDEWQRFNETLRELKRGDSDSRMLVQTLLESAQEATIDGQGRINLTDRLIGFAGLVKETKVLGSLDHLELWNLPTWEERQKGVDTQKFDALVRKLLS